MKLRDSIPNYIHHVITGLAIYYDWDYEDDLYSFLANNSGIEVYRLNGPIQAVLTMPSAISIARDETYDQEAINFFTQLYTMLKVHGVTEDETIFSSTHSGTSDLLTASMVYDLVDSGFNI